MTRHATVVEVRAFGIGEDDLDRLRPPFVVSRQAATVSPSSDWNGRHPADQPPPGRFCEMAVGVDVP
jgi:hypothetical protein